MDTVSVLPILIHITISSLSRLFTIITFAFSLVIPVNHDHPFRVLKWCTTAFVFWSRMVTCGFSHHLTILSPACKLRMDRSWESCLWEKNETVERALRQYAEHTTSTSNGPARACKSEHDPTFKVTCELAMNNHIRSHSSQISITTI